MGWAGSRKKKLDCHSPKLARGGAFCPPRLHTHPTTTCRVLPPSLFFHSQLRTWAFGNNHILLFSSTPPPPLLSFPFFPHRALLNHATPKKKKRGESKTKRRLHSFTPSPRVPSPLPPPQSAFARGWVGRWRRRRRRRGGRGTRRQIRRCPSRGGGSSTATPGTSTSGTRRPRPCSTTAPRRRRPPPPRRSSLRRGLGTAILLSRRRRLERAERRMLLLLMIGQGMII